jgi:LacI family repressor for deo operon, udp, cdd, tsx, nupC, and nupG
VASATATTLATGRSQTVGVLAWELNRWFHAESLEGVQAAADEAGYDVTLYRGGGSEERAKVLTHFLARRRVDATIAIGLPLLPEEVSALRRFDRPVVGIGGRIPGLTTLSVDDTAVARLATQHLISLGHRQIAHLGGHPEPVKVPWTGTLRQAGYVEAMRGAGLEPDIRMTPYSIDGGYRAAMSLLAHPIDRPTAIFAGSDEIAIGAITAARQLGIVVPVQLSVIGIDDHLLAELFDLTTFRQEPRLLGERAVRLALEGVIDHETGMGDQLIEVDPTLVVRSSTTAPLRP